MGLPTEAGEAPLFSDVLHIFATRKNTHFLTIFHSSPRVEEKKFFFFLFFSRTPLFVQDIEPTFLVFPHVKNRIKKTYFYASPYTPEKSVIARENSHRISYLSVSLFVCTPMMSIACYSRHGGICILPLAHVCVHLYLRCRFIQSFDLHTAGLHHLPTQ